MSIGAESDEVLLRDALFLLRKFENMPPQWPDGPKVFAGATDRAYVALEGLLGGLERARQVVEAARVVAREYNLFDTQPMRLAREERELLRTLAAYDKDHSA